ncbi:uncharacterized protein LOC125497709 [Beta vulgaris subsp. vulgaris]|uniref:uncharacterized protein LOC125497709 n=1 Tax=Beta vulgaris subsp. vulgaris TaxID=3555 RepID=UPI0020375E2F|nr:uncharacterized protein LOC125497709 [Beta vulgaris subsp. vulgaris]
MGTLYKNLCPGWCFTSNSNVVDQGRIVVAWFPNAFNVFVELVTDQLIHYRVMLWQALSKVKTNLPWVVMGDFNVVLNLDERVGSPVRLHEVADFRDCVDHCELADLKQCGRFFTWTNKQEGGRRVFSKIDRVMVNEGWRTQFENAMVHFMPEGDYDHCPGIVRRVWDTQVRGCPMFRVIQKLKQLKIELKLLNKQGFSDIQVTAYQAEQQMLRAQEQMHENPRDSTLVDLEKQATEEYKKAQAMYVSFLKQKAKDRWICMGDDNTKLFHQSIKARRTQNKIYAIQDSQG